MLFILIVYVICSRRVRALHAAGVPGKIMDMSTVSAFLMNCSV